MIKPTIYREQQTTTTADPVPIPPVPASAHVYETKAPVHDDGPFADSDEVPSFAEKRYSDTKRPYSDEKRPLSPEKGPHPVPYSETYHVEDVGESHKTPMAAPVPIVTETNRVEEQYDQTEPEYMTLR